MAINIQDVPITPTLTPPDFITIIRGRQLHRITFNNFAAAMGIQLIPNINLSINTINRVGAWVTSNIYQRDGVATADIRMTTNFQPASFLRTDPALITYSNTSPTLAVTPAGTVYTFSGYDLQGKANDVGGQGANGGEWVSFIRGTVTGDGVNAIGTASPIFGVFGVYPIVWGYEAAPSVAIPSWIDLQRQDSLRPSFVQPTWNLPSPAPAVYPYIAFPAAYNLVSVFNTQLNTDVTGDWINQGLETFLGVQYRKYRLNGLRIGTIADQRFNLSYPY
jgi:hypothetical protein